jgi:hypothetical protein
MDASRSILSGDKPTDALLDAYPSLREWRKFRVGLIAALIQITTWLALFCFIDLGISVPGPARVQHRIMLILLLAFFASVPIALAGVFLDKRKVLSAIFLGSILPALFILVLWSGNW